MINSKIQTDKQTNRQTDKQTNRHSLVDSKSCVKIAVGIC
jgi:hypothetical protein